MIQHFDSKLNSVNKLVLGKNNFSKWVYCIFFVICFLKSEPAVYYVSNSGDDSNPGTEEQPWKTLQKLNFFFRLEPGDQVLFRRGDSWTGSLKINGDGTPGNPIVFGAYGTGEKPKIKGSEVITGWTLHSGNIWKATIKESHVEQLFLNDLRMHMARYPDEGYYTVTGKTSNQVFTSTDLDPSMNFEGAACFIKSKPWAMAAIEVRRSNSKTITLTSAPPYGISENYGFWLTNKLEFLTKAGEWYFDSGKKTVYLWTPNGDSPDNYSVRASVYSHGISVSNRSNLIIQDFELSQTGRDGIHISGSSNIQIKNCDFVNPYRFGIFEELNQNTIIDNNTIEGANTGIRVMYSEKTTITNNEIQNTGQLNNFNKTLEDQDATAIFVRGNNHIIQYNRLTNIGYIGVNSTGLNVSIKNNYINGACQVLDDGGGIYIFSANFVKYPNDSYTVGTIIEGNIVLNVHGVMDGKPAEEAYPHGNGIYLDGSAKGVTVKDNTVNAVSQGIYIQGGGQHHITGNIFMDGMLGYRFNGGNENIIFSGNTVYQTGRVGRQHGTLLPEVFQKLVYSNIGKYGKYKFDNNTYVARYSQENIFRYTKANGQSAFAKDFSEWKRITGEDRNSTFINFPLETGETERLLYNDTKTPMIFDLGSAGFRDIYGKEIPRKLKLEPFTSIVLIGRDFSQINQKPDIPDQSFNIKSPVSGSDTIGFLTAFDPDPNQFLNYTVLNGEETDWITIDPVTGMIFCNLELQTPIDQAFKYQVVVNDNSVNSLSDTALVTVYVAGKDQTPPEITSFDIPEIALDLKIPVHTFDSRDNVGVAGYCLTETPLVSSLENVSWTAEPPTEFVFSEQGSFTIYAWARDSAGNVSNPAADSIIVIIPDLSPTFSEYLFEEKSGIEIIDTQGPNDGILVDDLMRVEGPNGSALMFASSGYIDLDKCFGENVREKISMSAWLKPQKTQSGRQGIIAHGGPDTVTFGLFIDAISSTIEFKTQGTTSSILTFTDAGKLWDGNWHHVAAVYNGEKKTIYLDGEIVAVSMTTGPIDLGYGYNLLIGAGTDELEPGQLYEGLLDEVRIYNYAIEVEEVWELFHQVNRLMNKVAVVESVTVCEGDEYLGWKQSGYYERVLKRVSPFALGADSVVATNFHVNPVYSIVENITIQAGEVYNGWTESGTYQITYSSSFGCDSTVVTNLTVEKENVQHIELVKGWNIFSSNLDPKDADMKEIMHKLQTENILEMVLDESGNAYEKQNQTGIWVNQIGELKKTEGYKIYVNSPSALEIIGIETELPLEIELKQGVNIAAFPVNRQMDAMQVFQPLIDAGILEKVQDEKGNSLEFWNSIGWVNGIGNLNPGEGYLVHTLSDGLLKIDSLPEKSSQIHTGNSQPEYFTTDYNGNGFAHMNINITGLNTSGLNLGDEIAIIDENICVGALKLDESHFETNMFSMPVSASDNLTKGGFCEENPVNFRVWRRKSNVLVDFSPKLLKGEMKFRRYSSLFVSIDEFDHIADQIYVYPNPARGFVVIKIPVLPRDGLRIFMVDSMGKEVFAGTVISNLEEINIENLPTGLYFLKVFLKNKIITHKLVVA